MKKLAFPSLVAACTLSASAFADPNQYSLVYSKSDFANYTSVAELHEKILRTAKAHCPSYFKTRALNDVNSCVNDVVQDLVRVIDNPRLTAYAEGDTSIRVAGEAPEPKDRS